MASASSRDARHVYHLSLPRLLLLPIVWALVVGPLFVAGVAGGPADEARAYLVSVLIVTLVVLPWWVVVWQSRLVLTPDGIAHHQFGYTVRSRWDNVEALSLDAGAQALLLREPGTQSRLLRWSSRFLASIVPSIANGMFGDADRLAEGRLILLSPFMAHWKRGLRDDLVRWAPRLVA
ncbi:MAG TPA: hypothetical protein VII68_06985 [Casimicrobiaceae bacterium]|jgi:hypothetical protein